ncbi:MAG: 1-acyl-sn-glycerol-3-phosphate acyltransferase [Eubacterium sp.]|nr:1-acyl-sn-glycerol-3-phosphate acyltransferase [Eubacterium sp.]
MNRIVYLFVRRCYMVPWMFHQIIKAGNSDKYTIQERYDKVKNVCHKVNQYAHVNIKATGIENLPKENGYILTPNHQGLFDVLLLIDTCDKPFSTVMRKDLENTPLLKQVMKALDGKTIDRDNPRQGMKIIKEMSDEISKGRNYVIFPEGTRSKKGNIAGDFKGGSFKSAFRVKAPIVPVALINSFKPFDIKDTKPVDVQIHYLEPLYYEDYKDMRTVEVAQLVKSKITEKIEKEINKR